MIQHRSEEAIGIDATVIRYEDEGAGVPIVLLHGNGCDRHSMRPFVDRLRESARILNVDLRGFGESDKPLTGLDFATMAADIKSVLEHLRIPKAILLGYSMGGRVAQVYALRYPTACSGLILVASDMVVRDPKVARDTLARKWSSGDAVELFAHVVTDSIRDTWRTVIEPAQEKVPDHVATAMRRQFQRYDIRKEMERCRVPVLVISGTEDRIVPPESSHEMARILPEAKLVMIPEAGHLVPFEQSDKTMKAIRSWLNKLAMAV